MKQNLIEEISDRRLIECSNGVSLDYYARLNEDEEMWTKAGKGSYFRWIKQAAKKSQKVEGIKN